MIQSIDYVAIAPPLILAITAGLVLLLDAFSPRRPAPAETAVPSAQALPTGTGSGEGKASGAQGSDREPPESAAGDGGPRPVAVAGTGSDVRPGGRRTARSGRGLLGLVTLAGVLAALGAVVAQIVTGEARRTFCVPEGLAEAAPACSFDADPFTWVFSGLMLLAGVVVVLLSMTELAAGRIPTGEWYFLLLCTLVGAVTLPASRDLIMLVVALELVSLPVFALTALKRYDGRASEAALKLFLVSVVSTAVTLFGVSLLYGLTGTVYLERIVLTDEGLPVPPAASVAVILVLAGFAFKVAAVPFHFWAGDVYQGAPVPVAALLSVISKAAGFAGLILLLATFAGQPELWVTPVAVIAALTMTVGNLLALRQRHAVRLLAWSSVAQSGYILAPLGVAGDVAASIAYLVFYAAMNLGAFAVVMLVSRRSERNTLDDYRGLVFRSPAAALALAFCLICLAGLPPGLAGLFAKVVVFRELVDGGGVALALIMAVNTVIGLYYYVAWTARLFSPAPVALGTAEGGEVRAAGVAVPVTLAITVSVAAAVLFSVFPQTVLALLP